MACGLGRAAIRAGFWGSAAGCWGGAAGAGTWQGAIWGIGARWRRRDATGAGMVDRQRQASKWSAGWARVTRSWVRRGKNRRSARQWPIPDPASRSWPVSQPASPPRKPRAARREMRRDAAAARGAAPSSSPAAGAPAAVRGRARLRAAHRLELHVLRPPATSVRRSSVRRPPATRPPPPARRPRARRATRARTRGHTRRWGARGRGQQNVRCGPGAALRPHAAAAPLPHAPPPSPTLGPNPTPQPHPPPRQDHISRTHGRDAAGDAAFVALNPTARPLPPTPSPPSAPSGPHHPHPRPRRGGRRDLCRPQPRAVGGRRGGVRALLAARVAARASQRSGTPGDGEPRDGGGRGAAAARVVTHSALPPPRAPFSGQDLVRALRHIFWKLKMWAGGWGGQGGRGGKRWDACACSGRDRSRQALRAPTPRPPPPAPPRPAPTPRSGTGIFPAPTAAFVAAFNFLGTSLKLWLAARAGGEARPETMRRVLPVAVALFALGARPPRRAPRGSRGARVPARRALWRRPGERAGGVALAALPAAAAPGRARASPSRTRLPARRPTANPTPGSVLETGSELQRKRFKAGAPKGALYTGGLFGLARWAWAGGRGLRRRGARVGRGGGAGGGRGVGPRRRRPEEACGCTVHLRSCFPDALINPPPPQPPPQAPPHPSPLPKPPPPPPTPAPSPSPPTPHPSPTPSPTPPTPPRNIYTGYITWRHRPSLPPQPPHPPPPPATSTTLATSRGAPAWHSQRSARPRHCRRRSTCTTLGRARWVGAGCRTGALGARTQAGAGRWREAAAGGCRVGPRAAAGPAVHPPPPRSHPHPPHPHPLTPPPPGAHAGAVHGGRLWGGVRRLPPPHALPPAAGRVVTPPARRRARRRRPRPAGRHRVSGTGAAPVAARRGRCCQRAQAPPAPRLRRPRAPPL
jgi:hypothetical protein